LWSRREQASIPARHPFSLERDLRFGKGVQANQFAHVRLGNSKMSEEKPIRPGENKLPVAQTNSTSSKIRSMDSAIARAKSAKKNVTAPLGKRLQTSYPVDKPNRSKFVRVHPDESYRMSYVPTYKDEDTDDLYFVDPDLELPGEIASQIKLTDLYAAQAHDGTFFIWFVNRSDTSWVPVGEPCSAEERVSVGAGGFAQVRQHL
jgi:hypothetical protein